MDNEIKITIAKSWKRIGLVLAGKKTNFLGTLAQEVIIKSIINNIELPISEKIRRRTTTSKTGKSKTL